MSGALIQHLQAFADEIHFEATAGTSLRSAAGVLWRSFSRSVTYKATESVVSFKHELQNFKLRDNFTYVFRILKSKASNIRHSPLECLSEHFLIGQLPCCFI